MLRALSATALTLFLCTVAALAAPGLSTRPYLPDPVEFELAAPAPPAGVAAKRGFVSPAIRTPKRFNLVGLSWSGYAEPAIAVRARKDGGGWTRWTPATGHGEHGADPRAGERTLRATSEPVWAGEADWVQYRMSRRAPGLRLHFVNTTGTATAKDRALTRLRTVAQAAFVHVAPAWGGANRPRIRPRSDWGGEKCPPREVNYGTVRAALVHHTVTANEYSRAQVPAAILAVCRFHRDTNGWNDIGYNFLVDRFGGIWEGRAGGIDEAVVGAQAQGYNSQTTGISNLGTFTDHPQADAPIAALARLIRWKLANHGVPSYGKTILTSAGGPSARYPVGTSRSFNRVSGHRDTGRTACPGEQLYRQLPELRQRVGEEVPSGEPLRVTTPLPEQVTYTEPGVTFIGRVVDLNAFPVEGITLELQRLGQTGWRTIAGATSQGDGNFAAAAELTAAAVLRWKYAGDEVYRPYRRDGARVAVAPAIALAGSATDIAPGESVKLAGSIAPPKVSGVTLVVEREDEGIWRRVGRKTLKPRRGRIARTWTFDEAGDYRASVQFAGDLANEPAVSAYVTVRVEEPF